MNISDIKESFEIIIGLIKKGATLEAQEKIIELKEKVISLQELNLELKKENLALKERIEVLEKGERCPVCNKQTWKVIGSKPHPQFGDMGGLERTFKCSECGHSEKHLFHPLIKS